VANLTFELSPITTAMDSIGSIGGPALLPPDSPWPACNLCGGDLVMFFQLRLPANTEGRFLEGSLLQVFACREHDDISGTIYSDYERFDQLSRTPRLPSHYWEISDGHYLIRLLPPDSEVRQSRVEHRLIHRPLAANAVSESDAEPESGLKLFGKPFWLQDAESRVCQCGASMELLLQVPDGYGFDMAAGALEQPNSFSHSQYCLFLGNQLYLLACARQCDPMALFPLLQTD
jgi:hypothetical protein